MIMIPLDIHTFQMDWNRKVASQDEPLMWQVLQGLAMALPEKNGY